MSLYELFLCDAASIEQLVQDARQKVRWAAEPVLPGESIGAQILKSSRELRLDHGLTRRVWYGYGVGPITYPVIYNAWCDLVERRAVQRPPAALPLQAPSHIVPIHRRPVGRMRRIG